MLNAETVPPLKAGTWYISPYNKNPQETSFTLTATVGSGGVPAPNGLFSFPPYDAVASPGTSVDPSAALPMGLGAVADGGDTLTLGFGTAAFRDPVDVYLGLYAPAIAPGEVFLFRSDNALSSLSSGLSAWRANTTAAIDASVLAGIPSSWLPAGAYYFYAIVTPAGRTDSFYFWRTQFGGTTGGTVMPDAETVLSSMDGSFRLSFPAGAVTEDTDVTISPLAGGAGYTLGPDGFQFQTPVAVSLASPVPASTRSSEGGVTMPLVLAIVESSDGTVEPLRQVSVSRHAGDAYGTVSGELSHFSRLYIWPFEASEGNFTVNLISKAQWLLVGDSTTVVMTAKSSIPFEWVPDEYRGILLGVVKAVELTDIEVYTSGVLAGGGKAAQDFRFTGPTPGGDGQVLLESTVTCRAEGDGVVTGAIPRITTVIAWYGIIYLEDREYWYSELATENIQCRGIGGCGDGIVNQHSEQCDEKDLNGKWCSDFGFDGGTLTCDGWCDFDTSACWKEQIVLDCGDGIINASDEECDGDDFGVKSCTFFGYDSGVLFCNADCTISVAGCFDVPTGDEVGMIGSLEGSFAHFSGYSEVQVSGTVINGIGNPVAGAQVMLTMTPGNSQTVTTNQGGQFQAVFTIGEYGTYTVAVTNVTGSGITYDAAGSTATSTTVTVN